jgi:hypothetical protein
MANFRISSHEVEIPPPKKNNKKRDISVHSTIKSWVVNVLESANQVVSILTIAQNIRIVQSSQSQYLDE